MKFDDKTLKKILLDGSYVTEADLKKAEEYSVKNHSSIPEYLICILLVNFIKNEK